MSTGQNADEDGINQSAIYQSTIKSVKKPSMASITTSSMN